MKFSLLIIVAVLCFACSTDYKKFQTPEFKAIAAGKVGVFDGKISLVSGRPIATLDTFDEVYVTDDSMSLGNLKFVRVTWGDSSGYVMAGSVVLHGEYGFLLNDANTFVNREGTPDTTFTKGTPVVIKGNDEVFTEIVYLKEHGPATVFIHNADISFGIPGQTAQAVEETTTEEPDWDVTTSQQDASNFETFAKDAVWTDPAGEEIDQAGAPQYGLFMFYFQGQQSKNHYVSNSFFDGIADEGTMQGVVENMKVVVVPTTADDITVNLSRTLTEKEGQPQSEFAHTFTNVTPGKAYVVTFDSYSGCFVMGIDIKVRGMVLQKTLSSDCSIEE